MIPNAGVSHPSVPADATLDANNPWPGLAAFREVDHAFFYGREEETEALQRLVFRESLTVFFGLSGLGKTSLLRAGLFPRLRDQNILPIYIRLNHADDSPDLAAQIKAATAAEAAAAGVEAPAMDARSTLWECFHKSDADFWNARNRVVIPLLVFDQFEEIFTIAKSTAARRARSDQLIEELANLAAGRPPALVKTAMDTSPEAARGFVFNRERCKLMISLREDFLPDLEGLRAQMPGILHNRLRLQRMNGQEALRAVTSAGRQLIEAPVAKQVIRFVSGETEATSERPLNEREVEPALLSLVCRELNNRRLEKGHDRITAELLEGSRSEILSNFYERSVADLPPAVRAFIEDRLITASGYRDSVALENALRTPQVTADSIDLLVSRRLLRLEERTGLQRIELTHDVLTSVVRASRDLRLVREARARDEAARREAEQRAVAALRELRRSRATTVVFFLVMLAAIAAAYWGFVQKTEASRQQQIAVSREVATSAMTVLPANSELSVLLARHAVETAPTLEAEHALRWALAQHHERLVMTGHTESVRGLAVSPDGRQIASADEKTVMIWDASSGNLITPFPSSESVNEVAFSPRGRFVIARVAMPGRTLGASESNSAFLIWDIATRRPFAAPTEKDQYLTTAAFSPDETRLVTVTGQLRRYDYRGNEYRDIEVESNANIRNSSTESVVPLMHSGWVATAAFSADGKLVVTTSGMVARIWDAEKGDLKQELKGHTKELTGASFNPDSTRVVTIDDGNGVRVWTLESGASVVVHDATLSTYGRDAAVFTATGHLVVMGDRESSLWNLDVNPGMTPTELDTNSTRKLAFSSDGRVAAAYDDGRVRLYKPGVYRREEINQNSPVSALTFSTGGEWLATAGADGIARVWDVVTDQLVTVLRGHAQAVTAVAFSPDGASLVTASEDKTVRLWRSEAWSSTAAIPKVLHGPAFLPEGGSVAVVLEDNALVVTDVRTGKNLTTHPGPTGTIHAASFSPDGKLLATATPGSTTAIWDAATGKSVGELKDPGKRLEGVQSISVSADQRLVLTTSRSAAAYLWDATTGVAQTTFEAASTDRIDKGTFSADGKLIVTAGQRSAQVWRVTGEKVAELRRADSSRRDVAIDSVAISRDGRYVVSTDVYSAHLWDLAPEHEDEVASLPLSDNQRSEDRPVRHAAFSPDGQLVVIVGGTLVRVLEAATQRVVREWKAVGPIMAAFSPDGKFIVTANQDQTVSLFTIIEENQKVFRGHTAPVLSAAFSRDGRTIVSGSADKTARVWDVGTGKQISVLQGHSGRVSSVAFNHDGSLVVTVSGPVPGQGFTESDRTTRVWEARTGKLLVTRAAGVAGFNADRNLVVSPSEQGDIVSLWDLASGRTLTQLSGLTGPVTTTAFSRDGTLVVAGGQEVGVWSVPSGQVVQILRGATEGIGSVAVSPDGKTVVAARGKGASVWNISTGAKGPELTGHESSVTDASFSPDGTLILTASSDMTARLWDARTSKQVGLLQGHTGGVMSATFSPDGTQIVTVADDDAPRLWNTSAAQTSQPQSSPLGGLGEEVNSATFSPDGKLLVTVAPRRIRVWEVFSGQVLIEYPWSAQSAVFSPTNTLIATEGDDSDRTTRILSCEVCSPVADLLIKAGTLKRDLNSEERRKYLHESAR